MFDCKACEAKTDEITHLRAIVTEMQEALEKAQVRVMELAAPGVNRRLRRVEEPERDQAPPATFHPQFPGYELRPEPQIVLSEDES